jgi:hypothetical protein
MFKAAMEVCVSINPSLQSEDHMLSAEFFPRVGIGKIWSISEYY